MVEFYKECDLKQTVAFPIFTGIQNGKLSVIGQFISEGMASALGILLKERNARKLMGAIEAIQEVTLDDNGLKDKATHMIFEAILHVTGLKVLNYSNNQLGLDSVQLIRRFIHVDSGKGLKELRITGVKAPKYVIEQLLDTMVEPHQIKKLKLSNLQLNRDPILAGTLNSIITNNCQLV
jgi:Ran GTPase-activating protein (RanGAP) involved in mRNA processing and transport